jgi:hypothetical protein
MKKLVIDMLRKDAEAQKSKALLTLKLLTEYPAGIGDHSTKDFYENANDALTMLVDADDKLEALKKYFGTE